MHDEKVGVRLSCAEQGTRSLECIVQCVRSADGFVDIAETESPADGNLCARGIFLRDCFPGLFGKGVLSFGFGRLRLGGFISLIFLPDIGGFRIKQLMENVYDVVSTQNSLEQEKINLERMENQVKTSERTGSQAAEEESGGS